MSFVEPAGDALIQTWTSDSSFLLKEQGSVPTEWSSQEQLRGTCLGFEFQVLTSAGGIHHYTDNQWFYSSLLVLSSHRSSSLLLQHDSIADLKLKFIVFLPKLIASLISFLPC